MPNSYKLDLKILPEKEKNKAEINIILKDSSWPELNLISANLIKTIPSNFIISHNLFQNNTLFFEINYMHLEEITKIIETFIISQKTLKLEKKQIFIKKLGGWFDF